MVWEMEPFATAAPKLAVWKFAGGKHRLQWNSVLNCGQHYCCKYHSPQIFGKTFARVHLQTVQNGEGVLLSYSSLATGCFKQNLKHCYKCQDKTYKTCKKTEDKCQIKGSDPETVAGCDG